MLEPAWLLTGGGSQHCQNKRSSGKGGGRWEEGGREKGRREEGRKEREKRDVKPVCCNICKFVAEALTHSFP